MQVKIKKLHDSAIIPKYAKAGDAGLDLTATSKKVYDGDLCITYGTGLSIEIPEGYVGLLFPRSSLSKYDLILTNHVGVLDSGYRGEIMFKFKHKPPQGYIHYTEYKIGDRIGQLLIIPYPKIELIEADELSSSDRGNSGYGSSGI